MVTILVITAILFVISYNKDDERILNFVKASSYTLWFLIGAPCVIVLLAIIGFWLHQVWCGILFILLMLKFINIVSLDCPCIRLFSLLLGVSSGYYLVSNIISGLNNPSTIDKETSVFIVISTVAMFAIVIVVSISNKTHGDGNMNNGKDIKQCIKNSDNALKKQINKLMKQIENLYNNKTISKNSLKNFHNLVNSNNAVKSNVKSLLAKLSMKYLGL